MYLLLFVHSLPLENLKTTQSNHVIPRHVEHHYYYEHHYHFFLCRKYIQMDNTRVNLSLFQSEFKNKRLPEKIVQNVQVQDCVQ